MITRKVAPALAAGCSLVIKPPSETPHTALALAKLAVDAGIPAKCIQVCPTKDRAAATELATSPLVSKLSFTGSTGVGRMLAQLASQTLEKVSLELGGNALFIVFDDVDPDLAVQGAMICRFRCTGQSCVCANRLLVQRGVLKEFTGRLVRKVKELSLGSGFEPSTTQRPLINKAAVYKANYLVLDAVKKGTSPETGGSPGRGEGYFFEPTVLSGMTKDIAISDEEIFGPVAAVFEFDTDEDVAKLANATEFGLERYLFSHDVGRVMRVSQHLQCGMIGVNTGIISAAEAPSGGIKQSEYGREGSKYGIDEYRIIKSVTIGNTDK